MTRTYIDGDGNRHTIHDIREHTEPSFIGFWSGIRDDGKPVTVYRTSLLPQQPGTVVDVAINNEQGGPS